MFIFNLLINSTHTNSMSIARFHFGPVTNTSTTINSTHTNSMSIARFHFGPVTNTSTTEKQVTASLVPPHGVEGLWKRLSSYSPVHLAMLHSCMHIASFPGSPPNPLRFYFSSELAGERLGTRLACIYNHKISLALLPLITTTCHLKL